MIALSLFRGTRRGVGLVFVLLVLSGCNSGSREAADSTQGAAASGVSSATATPQTSAPIAAPPPPAPTVNARLTLGDPGVETGLKLLRSEITPTQAATAWAAEGVSPAEAQGLVARLPLTPALGPGTHVAAATITDAWGRTTDISLQVPSSPAPAEGFPVVVFLHGLGGSSSQISGVAGQQAPDAIVVAPTALDPPQGVRLEDEAPIPGLGGAFPHWWVYRDHAFALRALDWVRERYPVDSDRVVLFGVSMGSFGTWNVGLRAHDRFAKLVPVAGGISRREFAIADPLTRRLLANAAMVPVWFAHGSADTVVPATHSQTLARDLRGLGISFTYREIAGGTHDTATFTPLLGEIQTQLTTSRRDPSPSRVTHRAIADDHLGAYWVVLQGAGSVDARVQGQAVTVTTGGGASDATVYLDERLLDVTRGVSVQVNGRTLTSAIPQASLLAVATSFARTRDPKLTYRFAVSSQ